MDRKLTKQEERLRTKYPETSTFRWYNANPKGHITADCTTRTVATALGISWEEALTAIYEVEKKHAVQDIKAFEKLMTQHGWVKHKQPHHEDGKKVTGAELCTLLTKTFPSGKAGNVVVIVANHMYCVCPTKADGKTRYKCFDTWNSTGKCVCNYWTKGGIALPDILD